MPGNNKRPSFQKERRGLITRQDHESNLAGALEGNVGIPSQTNRFVTEKGMPEDTETFFQTKAVITRKGGLVYNSQIQFVQRND